MVKQAVILTTGQPSTNPRMVKEYNLLKQHGINVKVYYSYWEEWAYHSDSTLFSTNVLDNQDFIMVGGSPFTNKILFLLSKIRHKVNRIVYNATGIGAKGALSRSSLFLIKAAERTKADIYIAHNLGAIAAAVAGAKKHKARAGFDAEDFHRGEYQDQNSKECLLVKKIEDTYLIKVDFVTTASPLIAEAYKALYIGLNCITINNVFSKKFLQKRFLKKTTEPLTIFWFSQKIGPKRGLETVIKVIEVLKEKCKIELYLLGSVSKEYSHELSNYLKSDVLHFIKPVLPENIFTEAAKYDIGLCVEDPHNENRDICLTNKLFTYLLAGNCIIFSNTKAQAAFFNSYPDVGFLYDSKNETQLENILYDLATDNRKLYAAQKSSLEMADNIFNWENESKKLIQFINSI